MQRSLHWESARPTSAWYRPARPPGSCR